MKKNVLLFGHGYATQFIDISNQYTALFDKEEYNVTVAYLVGEPNETIRKQHNADHVIFLNSPKKSTRGLKIHIIKKMRELHREKNFDLVVCHRYKPTYIMLWVSLFQRIPILYSVMHELGTMKNVSRRLLLAALARKNTIFAGVSNAVRDDLRRSLWFIPKERIVTLYNMIDVDATLPLYLSKEEARETLHLPNDFFIFGTLGRLAVNKDHKTLIQAYAAIKPQCPQSKLVILGSGQLETETRALIHSLNLDQDVILTGFIPQGVRFMKAFDVYISSSIQEAFGRVLLEAMLANLPIIATRVNGVPEVMGNTGKLIPARDHNAMSHEMLALFYLTANERHQRGEEGYQRASHDFSLQRFRTLFWQINQKETA